MHDDDMRHVHNVSDWRGVADEIEIELVEKCRTDRVRGNDIEERVAVRRCPHRSFGADFAACTGSILDDEPLTEPILISIDPSGARRYLARRREDMGR